MLGSMLAMPAAVRRHAPVVAFFFFGFVVLPLAVVVWRGGGTIELRIQHWNALRQSIQSSDPAREAIDDPDADAALIAGFLFPAAGRDERARSLYREWRANRDWWTVDVHLRSIDEDDAGTVATVTHEFEMKLLRDRVELERRLVARIDTWEKSGGVWYLRENEERVIEVFEPRETGFMKPPFPDE